MITMITMILITLLVLLSNYLAYKFGENAGRMFVLEGIRKAKGIHWMKNFLLELKLQDIEESKKRLQD